MNMKIITIGLLFLTSLSTYGQTFECRVDGDELKIETYSDTNSGALKANIYSIEKKNEVQIGKSCSGFEDMGNNSLLFKCSLEIYDNVKSETSFYINGKKSTIDNLVNTNSGEKSYLFKRSKMKCTKR